MHGAAAASDSTRPAGVKPPTRRAAANVEKATLYGLGGAGIKGGRRAGRPEALNSVLIETGEGHARAAQECLSCPPPLTD